MRLKQITAAVLAVVMVSAIPAASIAVPSGVISDGTAETDSVTQPGQSGTLAVSDLSAPANVTQGEDVEIEATLTNTGNDSARETVKYRFDGSVRGATSVNLDPDESEDVTFTLRTNGIDAGNYTHGVFAAESNQTAEIEIEADEGGEDDDDGNGQGPPEDVTAFKNTSALTAQQVDPNSLSGILRVEDEHLDNTTVELAANTSTEYTLNVTVTGHATNVTFFLQSQAIESSQDIDNVTAYLDGEELDFYVDEGAGPGNSPWILFEVDHFSTRTVTFASEQPEQPPEPPAVGDERPQDLDGDGLYQDVDGSGELDVGDVQLLFDSLDDSAVQDNAAAFDFDGDGDVSFADVRALLDDVRTETGVDYPDAAIFANDNGVITADGLNDGIGRYLAGDIGTEELNGIITAYLTGESVLDGAP